MRVRARRSRREGTAAAPEMARPYIAALLEASAGEDMARRSALSAAEGGPCDCCDCCDRAARWWAAARREKSDDTCPLTKEDLANRVADAAAPALHPMLGGFAPCCRPAA